VSEKTCSVDIVQDGNIQFVTESKENDGASSFVWLLEHEKALEAAQTIAQDNVCLQVCGMALSTR
jgi:hypothetical protein